MKSERLSYWSVFRLVFVIFCLYLIGDAFSRWDGFRYYASFKEFMPSVALVSILWTVVAAITAILLLIFTRSIEWASSLAGKRIRAEHLLLFICYLVAIGGLAWFSKRIILGGGSTMIIKSVFLLSVLISSAFITWLSRNHFHEIQERINPLVYLFCFLIIGSFPIVIYHTWLAKPEKAVTQSLDQSYSEEKPRPNIILVTFDALTARHMSVYGYYRPTTPFINEWAKSALIFARAKAETGYTQPTVASLMTGKRVWTHQRYHSENAPPPVKSDSENLALELQNNGYYNMAFITTPFASVKGLGIDINFEVAPSPNEFATPNSLFGVINDTLYRLFGDKIKLHNWIVKEDFILYRPIRSIFRDPSETIRHPENAFNKFLAVLDKYPPEPYFAWIHLFPPHDPYLPPKPYMGMFDPSSKARTYNSQVQMTETIGNLKTNLISRPRAQELLDIIEARYDEFIMYCDKQFEEFITKLKIRGRLKNTVIVLSADHGEEINFRHVGHGGISDLELHIPLIIKESNQIKGQIVNDLVEQIDIPATILELAHITVPSWMEGRSLMPLLRGEKLASNPAFSMQLVNNRSIGHEITTGIIAVEDGNYKLIHSLDERGSLFFNRNDGNRSLLFNLKDDPDELNNLSYKKPEITQHLLNIIQENLKLANERIRKTNLSD